jgi:hypothetical protein
MKRGSLRPNLLARAFSCAFETGATRQFRAETARQDESGAATAPNIYVVYLTDEADESA